MKNNKWIMSIFILFIFIGIIVISNKTSNSINNNLQNIKSISIIKDEHVVPNEKVYVELDGDKKHIQNIDMLLGNDKVKFKVSLKNINEDKPYFEVPNYSSDVVIGYKYFIKEILVKYDDGRLERYTVNSRDSLNLDVDEQKSYFVIDDVNEDIDAWRGFKSVDFTDSIYSNGNIYFTINGETKEMVDIELEWVRVDELKNFKTNVWGLGNRPFIDISEANVLAGEEYYLKNMTIYYNNGGSYYYNSDNYANILNNRIFIDSDMEESALKIEDVPASDGNKPNATNNTTREHNVAGGLVILFLVIVGAFGIFFYIKDEEE